MLQSIRNEKVAVGIKQSAKAVMTDQVKYIIIAEDVKPGLADAVLTECDKRNIEVKRVPSMIALGKSVGIDVGSAMVAVLK